MALENRTGASVSSVRLRGSHPTSLSGFYIQPVSPLQQALSNLFRSCLLYKKYRKKGKQWPWTVQFPCTPLSTRSYGNENSVSGVLMVTCHFCFLLHFQSFLLPAPAGSSPEKAGRNVCVGDHPGRLTKVCQIQPQTHGLAPCSSQEAWSPQPVITLSTQMSQLQNQTEGGRGDRRGGRVGQLKTGSRREETERQPGDWNA